MLYEAHTPGCSIADSELQDGLTAEAPHNVLVALWWHVLGQELQHVTGLGDLQAVTLAVTAAAGGGWASICNRKPAKHKSPKCKYLTKSRMFVENW